MPTAAAYVPALYWLLLAAGLVLGAIIAMVANLIGFKFGILRWGWDGGKKGPLEDSQISDLISRLGRIEDKLDAQQNTHSNCRENLLKEIADRVDIARNEFFKALDDHRHAENGKVTRQ